MIRSLYVHIPFCIKRCIYCDFVSGMYDAGKAIAYVDTLKKEICRIEADTQISTLYIGGGTPTVLSSASLSDLTNCIFTHFNFMKNYEATIEANPGTVDMEKLNVLRSAGLNRVSIGVQSFDGDELAFLGRVHTAKEAGDAVHLARDAGFENIGIDLIYGIPGQDMTSWMKTLEKAVMLKPNHISTYELTVEEGTELHKYVNNPLFIPPLNKGGGRRVMKDDAKLLPEDKIIEMYERTIDYLKSSGYIHYEISNFALPGYLCRHNLNYWDRGEYYGAGLGAHSFMNGTRFHNTDDLDEYQKLIKENRNPSRGSETITEDMAVSEAVFLGLRKTGGLNVEDFSKRYRKNILSFFQKEINELSRAGLIEVASSGCAYETALKLTRKGLVLSNEVFVKFIK